MKILWLTHPESDYASSMLFDAFTTPGIGVERIDFFPHKWSYFGRVHNYQLPSIPNGTTGPTQWMESAPQDLIDPYVFELSKNPPFGYMDAIWEKIVAARLEKNDYDLVILESQRMAVQQALSILNVDHYVAKRFIPTLVLDGEDYTDVLLRTANLRVDLLLKREYTENVGKSDKTLDGNTGTLIAAYPFCTVRKMLEAVDSFAWNPSECDASMLVGNTFPIRGEIAKRLRDAPDLNTRIHSNIDGVNCGDLLDWSTYIFAARSSRCTVVPRGWGYDTLRFWELLPATILCAQRTPLVYPFPFVDKQSILWWETPEDCENAVRWLRSQSENVVASIFDEAIQHTKNHHTSAARIRYVLEMLADIVSMKNLRKDSPVWNR